MSIANTVAPAITSTFENTLSTVNPYGHLGWVNKTDASKTTGRIASAYQTAAENSFKDSIAGLQGLVGSFDKSDAKSVFDINSNKSFGALGDQIEKSGKQFDAMQDQLGGLAAGYNQQVNQSNAALDGIINNLGGIGSQIGDAISGINGLQGGFQPVFNNLNGVRDALGGIADNIDKFLPGYVDRLNGMGDSIWGTGSSLVDMGGMFNTEARNLMNMDASGGGLIGNYITQLNQIDPEKYVSMAATDAQRQFQNAQAQQNRQLGRSGVDAGSARSIALNQQYAQAMAAASAGAKFRARLQGQNEKLAATTQAIGIANSLAQLGTQTMGAGVQAQGAGAGLIGNAANLQLGGEQAKAQIQGQQLNVESAWLNALGAQLQNYQAGIDGLKDQAVIFGQQAQTEAQKLAAQQSAAKMGMDAENAKASIEAQKISAAQAKADLDVKTSLTASTSLIDARIKAASALASAQQEAGKMYMSEAEGWGKMAGQSGLMSALFG